MKKTKRILGFSLAILMLFTPLFLTGCGKDDKNNSSSSSITVTHVRFGEFSYKGRYLTSYATNPITSQKAKEIATTNSHSVQPILKAKRNNAFNALTIPNIPTEYSNKILSKYSGCQVLTRYYVEDMEGEQTKTDMIHGTDFKSVIEKNEFIPFSQLVAKYLIAFPELIDYMEQANAEFRNSGTSIIAPFLNIFSYHTNETGNLIIQTRDFSEISSSIGGGIGSSYRQDTEILYDAENKISKWQTSLGIYSATPSGTMKQGYILEVQFSWIVKS